MEQIRESLEQRIDCLKIQRDLSILIWRSGIDNELKSEQTNSINTTSKNTDIRNDAVLSWNDTLDEKMRELDDALRKASDDSINRQVQLYLQQVRIKNKAIIELTQRKEEIESKMLQEVPEEKLRALQRELSELIKEYEDIIKQKIDIFTMMIQNLK